MPEPFDSLPGIFKAGRKSVPADLPVVPFQITLHGRSLEADDVVLERGADEARQILEKEAKGIALGVVSGCDLAERKIELEFTIEAVSAAELHQRLGKIMRILEESGPFLYGDSTAARLDSDVVPA